jgi:dTDP-4-amino-4,6-dideoxygalactose transaminase
MYERNNVIRQFERTIAKHCGAPYAVAVESCTAALFFCFKYLNVRTVEVPKRTYHSVPMQVLHSGGGVKFVNLKWKGDYRLNPYPIIDSAVRFKKNMYEKGTFRCLSFQYSKHIPIGRGGMILTDSKKAADLFRLARNDQRQEIPKEKDDVRGIGWNAYMTPEQAARGLSLFYWRIHSKKDLPDIDMNYMDLSTLPVFKQKGTARVPKALCKGLQSFK